MAIWYHSATEKPCDVPGEFGSQNRFYHVDDLLHSRVTSTDSESDVDDVPDLQLTPAPAEPDVSTPTLRL